MRKKINLAIDTLIVFNRRQKQKIIIFLVIFLGSLCTQFIFSSLLPVYSHNKPAEIRGVWLTNIDSEVLFEPKM